MVGLKIKEYLDEKGIKYSYLSKKSEPDIKRKKKIERRRIFCNMQRSWVTCRNICAGQSNQ